MVYNFFSAVMTESNHDNDSPKSHLIFLAYCQEENFPNVQLTTTQFNSWNNFLVISLLPKINRNLGNSKVMKVIKFSDKGLLYMFL